MALVSCLFFRFDLSAFGSCRSSFVSLEYVARRIFL